jgi:hypothetical protein
LPGLNSQTHKQPNIGTFGHIGALENRQSKEEDAILYSNEVRKSGQDCVPFSNRRLDLAYEI